MKVFKLLGVTTKNKIKRPQTFMNFNWVMHMLMSYLHMYIGIVVQETFKFHAEIPISNHKPSLSHYILFTRCIFCVTSDSSIYKQLIHTHYNEEMEAREKLYVPRLANAVDLLAVEHVREGT